MIVSDDILNQMPFECLITDNTNAGFSELPYLIKTHSVSYHFSATFWQTSHSVSQIDMNSKLLGFAPVYFTNNNSLEKTELLMQELAKLPNAEIFLRDNATETNFKGSTKDAAIVVIVSHGEADRDGKEQPRMYFYSDSVEKDENDGVLYLNEIYNLELNSAQLVVLAGCETGTGFLMKGEGLQALTRGFIYAGTKRIVFSFWSVNEEATIELFKCFFTELTLNKDIATALQNAKLKLINNELYAFPSYWGGFVVF